jgi:hypothetical protein
MHADSFDPILTLELLRKFDLFEWPGSQPSSLLSSGDPLEALQAVADFHLQVEDAADLIGRCMIIEVERFLNPHICIPPITLSDTERTRIACTLWILKIYYQLRLRFSGAPTEYATLFCETFVRNLKPWQIDQCLSLEQRLLRCHDNYTESLNHYDQTDAALLERLSESRYVSNFLNMVNGPRGSLHYVHRFSGAAGFLHDRGRVGRVMKTWYHNLSDVGHPLRPSSIPTQLRNHAWINSEPTEGIITVAHTDRYMNICRHLGLFFWDYNRLECWHVADPNNLIAAADAYPGLSPVATRYDDTPWWELGLPEASAAIERTKQRQITEWTRCPVQYTMNEWLYQKTCVAREKEGLAPVPRKYVEFGITCTACGLDGHRRRGCDSKSCSADEKEVEPDV